VAASSGRKGRPWRRCRAIVLASSTICHLCGHDGAGDGDHHPFTLQQLRAMGEDPNDPRWVKPAHGALSRCPTCGRCCNQMKGDRPTAPHTTASRAW
jgi:hypothetical protein